MTSNLASIALLGGVTIISASVAIMGYADRAYGQTVTPPPEILIDRDPIAMPPPNIPAVRRAVAPVVSPSPNLNRATTSSSPSINSFRSNQFSAANAPAPVSGSVIPPTNNYTAANTTPRNNAAPNNVTINRNYRSNYQAGYSDLSNGNFNNTGSTTVAASDPVNLPANVPVGNPDTPGEINQLFAFLSQNIPPVDGQPNELNYAVVLPATSDSLLSQIQEIVPTAKVISSRRGSCIQVQAYRERGRAESLTAMLRSVGFDARVLHQSGI
ncbi:MAG: hypothetical protein WCO45_16825 [Pseudanabaena sp. ELA607]